MARLFRDNFAQWLEANGRKPGVYQPFGILGGPPLGWLLPVGRITVSWRVEKEDPAVMMIVMIERQAGREALRSPFADLLEFLLLVRRSEAGVRKVQGRIDSVSWGPPDRMGNEQMFSFYVRHLGGEELRVDADGVPWVTGDLDAVIPFLMAHRRRDRRVAMMPAAPAAPETAEAQAAASEAMKGEATP